MTPELPPGITNDMVQESARATVAYLMAFNVKLDHLLDKDCQEIASKQFGVQAYLSFYDLLEDAIETLEPVVACKRGCDHCCKMSVVMSEPEAKIIAKHLGIHYRIPDVLYEQDEYVQKYMAVPCPFLKKHQCSIYEVRPLACRTHFNISEYPEVCNVIDYPGNDVPNLDWRTFWMVSAIAANTLTFGDIRQFFPDGANEVQSL